MTQQQLNRAVSRATGESTSTIARLGFGVADPAVVCFDPEPLVIDWDDRDAQQRVSYLPQRARSRRKPR